MLRLSAALLAKYDHFGRSLIAIAIIPHHA
jgi:hypothetical protein